MRRTVAILVAAALMTGVPVLVGAQPTEPGQSAIPQRVKVSLRFGAPSLTPADTFTLGVDTELTAAAEYFEVRVRIWRPSGALMYQKTEVRHNVEAGSVSVGFERELADLSATPGRYPMELRVLVSDAEPTLVESRMLVAEKSLGPLPIAVVARLTCSPALDPSGRFALDPATHNTQRTATDALVALVSGRSESLTVAVPPLLLEEWSRAASGYQLLGAEGIVEVLADSEVSRQSASTIEALSRAVQTGRVELLDVPYAEPDMGGLQDIGAVDDLTRHYVLGRSVYRAVLNAKPSTGTDLNGHVVSVQAAKIIAETGHGYLLCSPESSPETMAPGVYREAATGVVTLVTDTALKSLVSSGTDEEIYDHLFDAAMADGRTGALVVTLDIGPGQEHNVDDVQRLLTIVDGVAWLEPVSTARAAQLKPAGAVTLVDEVPSPSGAPRGYWDDVAEARRNALGLVEAWGAEDPESAAALSSVLISESCRWAGPDGSYPFADRGREFSAIVTRLAEDVFGNIRLEMRDVTLAARAGNVPLTIISTAERPLMLRVETRADALEPHTTETIVSVKPADNFLTIPVDLGPAVSDTLEVRVMAGDVLVAETTVTVRASYLDRLTTMVAVVLVLVALLLFIRRRVKAADAGTMPGEADEGCD